MNIDFTIVDKSDFECIRIGNDSEKVYYGQLSYYNPETKNLLKNLDEIEDEDEKAKYQKVRHGVGI